MGPKTYGSLRGELVRLALLQALSRRSDVLLLDQVFTQLDPLASFEIFRLVLEHCKRNGSLVVELGGGTFRKTREWEGDRFFMEQGTPRRHSPEEMWTERLGSRSLLFEGLQGLCAGLASELRMEVREMPRSLEDAANALQPRWATTAPAGTTREAGPPGAAGILVEGLSFRYPSGFRLVDVNLAVPRGKCAALVGANGAGRPPF